MQMNEIIKLKTLGELKKSGYRTRPIKDEMRENLRQALINSTDLFKGIKGFEESVIPQLQTAILSRHNIIFLGLRGQAKTKIARLMTALLDEYIPIVKDSELNDDPFHPISRYAIDLITQMGDDTPVSWLHRDDRYAEKLATPDVSVSDLIGDVDPIKAAALKLNYSDERVIHYGLIPRSNRSIFTINELPDLQPRIQVALFNILQEGDIQIRGFRLRLPLDIQFVFTANPEDYTNRGSIVTPLKDRIGSQILTHYPKTVEIASAITAQESRLHPEQKLKISTHHLLTSLVEQVAFEARLSEYIDQKSGVSARLTISANEIMHSTAERRMLMNREPDATLRISDLYGIIPSITGKVELVYEGETEGITSVAYTLIGKAIRNVFVKYFPDPEKAKKSKMTNPYSEIINWFSEGNEIDLMNNASRAVYEKSLKSVPALMTLVKKYVPKLPVSELYLYMEFVLHGLAEYSQLSKKNLETGTRFNDLMTGMFNMKGLEEEEN
jgi:magnesium chelatase subunit I